MPDIIITYACGKILISRLRCKGVVAWVLYPLPIDIGSSHNAEGIRCLPQDVSNHGHGFRSTPFLKCAPHRGCRGVRGASQRPLSDVCEFLIGVHCTHGLNRTGYMVCRYMRDRLGISAQEAIEEFQNARGYAIERQNYVADILGENPPPPEVGDCSTIVRPIDESPVVYRSKSKKSKKKSYNNIPNDKNYYESKKSKTKVKRRHKSNQSYSNRSSNDYNFKYDY
ncbi:unnamed protein product [Danaus chrysippus]|uniref:(African queen) hypothetical protein n=1 Tax=Danaus chrysippus TaxID=151541 RepID=A0A8J2QP08_9NEOP|nr:unnamed protein product [Danaus chrysippus]